MPHFEKSCSSTFINSLLRSLGSPQTSAPCSTGLRTHAFLPGSYPSILPLQYLGQFPEGLGQLWVDVWRCLCPELMSENLQAYASSGTSRISHANTHMCILLGASGKGTHLNTGPSVARLASINHSHCASRVAEKYVGEEGLSFCHISSSSAVTSDLLTYIAQIHFPCCLPGLHLQNYKEISRHHLWLLWPSTLPPQS